MTNTKSILSSLLTLLKSALDSAYYQQAIPSELDDGIGNIIVTLSACSPKDLETIISSISRDDARVLGLFSERMASLAVRKNNIEYVKRGLLALLICAQTEDPRDVLLILSLLHDAVIKVDGIPKEIFDEASSIVDESLLLNDFLKRSDEDKSIDAMGYEESKNEEGFLYLRTW